MEFIYLIITVGLILFLLYVGYSFFSFFIEGKADRERYESTISNLKALSGNIKNIVKDEKFFDYKITPYYISDEFILVGFNYDGNSVTDTVYTPPNLEKIEPPDLCKGKACLCIYKNQRGKSFSDNGFPLECEDFNQNIVFLAPGDKLEGSTISPPKTDDHFRGGKYTIKFDDSYINQDYEFLVLYGHVKGSKAFKVKTLYIEKIEEKDKIYVFIAKYKDDPDDPIYKRKKDLESIFKIENKN
jgi:hypothetical protein